MFKLYKKYEEIINYLIFGVLTTLVSIISYFIFSKIFGVYYLISNIISWILSVLFAYITNKLYVFKSNNKIIKELINFFSSRIFTFIVDMMMMYILVSILKLDDMLVKIIVQIIVIVLNYVLSKLFVFKKTIVTK